MSKISNTKLILILLVLGAIIGVVTMMDSKKGERNFRSELVEFDSAKVTSISIYPKSKPGEEVKLYKEGKGWKVKISDKKSVAVDDAQISSIFNQLAELKPKRLAGKSQDKWSEFQVDSAATRLVVNEGDKKVLDLVIGKFSFQQGGGGGGMQMQMQGGRGQSFESFVRLKDEHETYSVDGFLDPTFNQDASAWRNKTIIKGNKDEWRSLSFTLPAFGSYVLENKDSVWQIGGQLADAQEVDNYLNSIAHLTGNSFNDDFEQSALGAADFVLEISTTLGDKIKIEGFAKDIELLRSSLNPESLFNATDEKLFEKIFVGSTKFFPADTLGGEI